MKENLRIYKEIFKCCGEFYYNHSGRDIKSIPLLYMLELCNTLLKYEKLS